MNKGGLKRTYIKRGGGFSATPEKGDNKYMKEFNEAIAALKAEYEQRLAEKEAENARLRGINKKAD